MSRTKLPSLLALLALAACACGGLRTTQFLHPDFNFAFVERVAVVPLENLSDDTQAATRATRLLVTELLASGAVEVVEPGEVRAALARIPGAGPTPSSEQVVALGKALGVQAVVTGSVTQSENMRSGTVVVPVVTVDLHLVETESGQPVWAATESVRGGGAGAKLLGTGGEPISETTRRCVRRLVRRLVR